MNIFSNIEINNTLIATAVFVVILVIVLFVYRVIYYRLRKKVIESPGKIDDFILNLFRIPTLWLIYWILLKLFTHLFLNELAIFSYMRHINSLLLVFTIAWIAIQSVRVGAYFLQRRLDIENPDNLLARQSLTKIKVFSTIAHTLIILVAISAGLLTFEQARTIGISLLTSAGIIGLIVGFAAQKSIGMVLAGIQLAIAQPIRLDDVVIVEGEWGRVEELTLTYVVIRIWDERRLILPVTYFLEKPFQNWTRKSAAITGSVFLYLDYGFPVSSLRNILPSLLKDNSNWDGRTANVEVTNTTENHKEVRVLLSSTNASKNWDLRTEIREKLIDYINTNYPDSFSKIRIKNENDPQPM